MSIIEYIILGIVQGLAEFLPISSSGHLVLLQNIFGMHEPQLFFNVMLHAGTLAAVVIVLWKDIVDILKNILRDKRFLLLVIATIPAVIATLLFGDFFETTYGGKYLGFEFIVSGLILVVAESVYTSVSMRKYDDINLIDAIVMGVLQAFAIFPAISRSGATISGGLLRRMDRKATAKFAFLMSIPGILGGLVVEAKDLGEAGLGSVDWVGTILGMVFALASGILAVRFMIAFVSRKKLYGFGIYTLILGLLVVLDQYVFHLAFK